MKQLVLLFGVIILLTYCKSNKEVVKVETETVGDDSVTYDLIVDEPGYLGWMVTNSKPLWYYSHNYYQTWNNLYLREFNYRVTTGFSDHPFDEVINYNSNIEYNVELDYGLFWYFKFIEQKYNMKLIPYSR